MQRCRSIHRSISIQVFYYLWITCLGRTTTGFSRHLPLGWTTTGRHETRLFTTDDEKTTANNDGDREASVPDLFDYFDPLLSPHEYPDGITPSARSEEQRQEPQSSSPASSSFVEYDPLRLRLGMRTSKQQQEDRLQRKENSPNEPQGENMDVFDPLLSPHAYPNGTPERVITDLTEDEEEEEEPLESDVITKHTQKKVGILLMDHGSRNQASNDRLHALAEVYQKMVIVDESAIESRRKTSANNTQIIVRAAHMELANPSIPEGLESLLKEGVDEIVCHPYFLSAAGRHVTEDIPAIIQGAIKSLDIHHIPISTTEPVGSQTEFMINAIQSIVEKHSTILRQAEAEEEEVFC